MKTINTLVMNIKSNESLKNVYHNEDYLFYISNLKSVNDKSIEIETDIASSPDVDLKVVSVDKDKLLVEDRNGNKEWFTFIDKDGLSRLYLSELKNNKVDYKDSVGHFDVTIKNEDIMKLFEVTEITI